MAKARVSSGGHDTPWCSSVPVPLHESSPREVEGLSLSPSFRPVWLVYLWRRIRVRKAEDAAVAEADGTLGVGRRRPDVLVTPRFGGRRPVARSVGHYRLCLSALDMLDEGLSVSV